MGWAAEGDANGYWLLPDTGTPELLPPLAHSSGPEVTPASPSTTAGRVVAAQPAAAVTPSGPTAQAAASVLASSQRTFALEQGSPQYMADFANTAGCSWQGIVGQVLDEGRRPVLGDTVSLEGGGLHLTATTGSTPEYGPAGFELYLGSQPQTTTQTYVIQLHSPNGTPLSVPVTVPTYADCDRTVAVVIFVPSGQ